MHICFFDIDGTLILTGGAGQAAFAETLAHDFGIPEITTQVLFAGRSDRAIAMDLFRAHGVEPTSENWQRFYHGYLRRLESSLPTRDGNVLPGVIRLLEMLAARGDISLGLITGNVREAARTKLTYYNLWHWFPFGGFGDEHIDRNDIAADAVAAGRAHLADQSVYVGQGTPWGMVVVGDTLNDICCGRSIGARCVAVPTGHTSADALRGGEPDVLVETLEDVSPILALFDGAAS